MLSADKRYQIVLPLDFGSSLSNDDLVNLIEQQANSINLQKWETLLLTDTCSRLGCLGQGLAKLYQYAGFQDKLVQRIQRRQRHADELFTALTTCEKSRSIPKKVRKLAHSTASLVHAQCMWRQYQWSPRPLRESAWTANGGGGTRDLFQSIRSDSEKLQKCIVELSDAIVDPPHSLSTETHNGATREVNSGAVVDSLGDFGAMSSLSSIDELGTRADWVANCDALSLCLLLSPVCEASSMDSLLTSRGLPLGSRGGNSFGRDNSNTGGTTEFWLVLIGALKEYLSIEERISSFWHSRVHTVHESEFRIISTCPLLRLAYLPLSYVPTEAELILQATGGKAGHHNDHPGSHSHTHGHGHVPCVDFNWFSGELEKCNMVHNIMDRFMHAITFHRGGKEGNNYAKMATELIPGEIVMRPACDFDGGAGGSGPLLPTMAATNAPQQKSLKSMLLAAGGTIAQHYKQEKEASAIGAGITTDNLKFAPKKATSPLNDDMSNPNNSNKGAQSPRGSSSWCFASQPVKVLPMDSNQPPIFGNFAEYIPVMSVKLFIPLKVLQTLEVQRKLMGPYIQQQQQQLAMHNSLGGGGAGTGAGRRLPSPPTTTNERCVRNGATPGGSVKDKRTLASSPHGRSSRRPKSAAPATSTASGNSSRTSSKHSGIAARGGSAKLSMRSRNSPERLLWKQEPNSVATHILNNKRSDDAKVIDAGNNAVHDLPLPTSKSVDDDFIIDEDYSKSFDNNPFSSREHSPISAFGPHGGYSSLPASGLMSTAASIDAIDEGEDEGNDPSNVQPWRRPTASFDFTELSGSSKLKLERPQTASAKLASKQHTSTRLSGAAVSSPSSSVASPGSADETMTKRASSLTGAASPSCSRTLQSPSPSQLVPHRDSSSGSHLHSSLSKRGGVTPTSKRNSVLQARKNNGSPPKFKRDNSAIFDEIPNKIAFSGTGSRTTTPQHMVQRVSPPNSALSHRGSSLSTRSARQCSKKNLPVGLFDESDAYYIRNAKTAPMPAGFTKRSMRVLSSMASVSRPYNRGEARAESQTLLFSLRSINTAKMDYTIYELAVLKIETWWLFQFPIFRFVRRKATKNFVRNDILLGRVLEKVMAYSSGREARQRRAIENGSALIIARYFRRYYNSFVPLVRRVQKKWRIYRKRHRRRLDAAKAERLKELEAYQYEEKKKQREMMWNKNPLPGMQSNRVLMIVKKRADAATVIQKYVRRLFAYIRVFLYRTAIRNCAFFILRCVARMRFRKLKPRIKAARVLQAVVRSFVVRSRLLRQIRAAKTINRAALRYKERRVLYNRIRRLDHPCVVILNGLKNIPRRLVFSSVIHVKISVWWTQLLHIVSEKDFSSIIASKKPHLVYETKSFPVTHEMLTTRNYSGSVSPAEGASTPILSSLTTTTKGAFVLASSENSDRKPSGAILAPIPQNAGRGLPATQVLNTDSQLQSLSEKSVEEGSAKRGAASDAGESKSESASRCAGVDSSDSNPPVVTSGGDSSISTRRNSAVAIPPGEPIISGSLALPSNRKSMNDAASSSERAKQAPRNNFTMLDPGALAQLKQGKPTDKHFSVATFAGALTNKVGGMVSQIRESVVSFGADGTGGADAAAATKSKCSFDGNTIVIPSCHGNSVIKFEFYDGERRFGNFIFFMGKRNPGKMFFCGGDFSDNVALNQQRRNMNIGGSTSGLDALGTLGRRRRFNSAESSSVGLGAIDGLPVFEYRVLGGNPLRSCCSKVKIKISGLTGPLNMAVQNHRGLVTSLMTPWHYYFMTTLAEDSLAVHADKRDVQPVLTLLFSSIVGLQSEYGDDVILNDKRHKHSYAVSNFTVNFSRIELSAVHTIDSSSCDLVVCTSFGEKMHLKFHDSHARKKWQLLFENIILSHPSRLSSAQQAAIEKLKKKGKLYSASALSASRESGDLDSDSDSESNNS